MKEYPVNDTPRCIRVRRRVLLGALLLIPLVCIVVTLVMRMHARRMSPAYQPISWFECNLRLQGQHLLRVPTIPGPYWYAPNTGGIVFNRGMPAQGWYTKANGQRVSFHHPVLPTQETTFWPVMNPAGERDYILTAIYIDDNGSRLPPPGQTGSTSGP